MSEEKGIYETEENRNLLRREVDLIQRERLKEMGALLIRLHESLEENVRETTRIQATNAALLERIAAFHEKFVDHDRKDAEDRDMVIKTLERITESLNRHEVEIQRHAEAISTLKQWGLMIVAAISGISTGGLAWILNHVQTTMR